MKPERGSVWVKIYTYSRDNSSPNISQVFALCQSGQSVNSFVCKMTVQDKDSCERERVFVL